MLEAFQRGQIAVGKSHIRPLHPGPIFEDARGNTFLNLDRNIAVKSGKETDAAVFFAASEDDLIQLLKYFVDSVWRRLRWQGAPS